MWISGFFSSPHTNLLPVSTLLGWLSPAQAGAERAQLSDPTSDTYKMWYLPTASLSAWNSSSIKWGQCQPCHRCVNIKGDGTRKTCHTRLDVWAGQSMVTITGLKILKVVRVPVDPHAELCVPRKRNRVCLVSGPGTRPAGRKVSKATSGLTGVNLDEARRALGTILKDRIHRDVVQGAWAQFSDDGMSLIDCEIEGICLIHNLYLVGIDWRWLIIIDLPGHGQAGGTDVHKFDVKNLTGICEDTRGVHHHQTGREMLSSRHLIQETLSNSSSCSTPFNTADPSVDRVPAKVRQHLQWRNSLANCNCIVYPSFSLLSWLILGMPIHVSNHNMDSTHARLSAGWPQKVSGIYPSKN